ncbi:hypothetical protein C8Q72DRAFT_794861 [Fomitopsis betulina]|nr:hypothetical protein C8Q72DRAFT_794861 [Fomitopsis betulina]
MTLPHIDHKSVISIWREVMKSIHKQFAPPEQLQEALNMVHSTAPWMTRVIINDSDDKKWPDSLFSTMIGKNRMVDLGPLEVGGSQHLHGRQGVLAMLEGMAHHHQVEVRAGKTRQWAQMMVFKLYEHSTDITLKRVIKKKGKESSDKELVSQLNKVSGRYPLLSVGESSPYDTTVLLPETGPWKQGASKLIVGALCMLWFHIPFNRINKFYRVLQQAKEATSKGQHVLAEEKWIIGGFALPILPIDEYCGLLCPLLNNFLKSL